MVRGKSALRSDRPGVSDPKDASGAESMGMYLEEPAVTLPGRRHSWSEVSENAFALVGMDAFQVPWTPLFGLQHGPHYFIAQKKNGDAQFCIDPTYGIENQTLSSAQLYEKSYAMIPVYITDKPAGFPENPASAAAQAHEVLQSHPKTLKFFISQAEKWIREDPEIALHPAKIHRRTADRAPPVPAVSWKKTLSWSRLLSLNPANISPPGKL